MRPSVQMYHLVSEKNGPLTLRELRLDMPLKCKEAEAALAPLSAQALLDFETHKVQSTVQLDSETLSLSLTGKGQRYALTENAESLRLKRHLLQCWVMLLRARQIKLATDHAAEISRAQEQLKQLKYDGEKRT